MVSIEEFNKLVLGFEGVTASPHFNRTAFKTKKTFVTLNEKDESVNVILTPIQQSVYVTINKEMIFAVPNKWGFQGWTTIQLSLVDSALLKEILDLAYDNSLK